MKSAIITADDISLEAMFNLEIDNRNGPLAPDAAWSSLQCQKCKGGGKFIGYTGRIVGECFACKGTGLRPERTQDDIAKSAINVGKIQIAFASARANGIKRPKLRLDAFTFSRAPDTGKNAGSIYVKQGEQYLGKVTDGQFYAVRECGDERKARVIQVAAAPDQAAKAYGLRTGTCSCCGRELTNKDSIDLGIGPICAEKFGW